MANFDFKEIAARAAFDYIGLNFPSWWKKNSSRYKLPNLGDINGVLLGKQYFMTLKVSYKGETFELPNEPLVSLGLAKTIVETATVGRYRKGTVKEYIVTEDYQITIKGICINEEDPEEYPTKQIQLLNKVFEINDSLEIVGSLFFELYGIRNIVFKEIAFEEMKGQPGAQIYTLTAVSDQDFYADLNEKELNKQALLS